MTTLLSIMRESASALLANPLRTFLTIIGIVLGVASVITIVSAVEGMQSSMEEIFDSMGPRTLIVARVGIAMTMEEYAAKLKRKKLTRDLIPLVEAGCPDCDAVGAEAHAQDDVKYGKNRMNRLEIDGQTPNVFEMGERELLAGRSMSWEDERRRRRVVMIGSKVADKLFEGEDPIGKRMRIGEREFTVIGVVAKIDDFLASGVNDFAAIPLSTLQSIYRQPGNPVILFVRAASMEARQAAIDQVRVVMRSARRVPYEADDDFTILTPDSILSIINQFTRAFRVLIISLPLLSIVIGGIVVMNIMMISVTERTREIGIRKSIGAKQRMILVQFLYESLMLSLVGGSIGVLIGVKLGQMLNTLMDIQADATMLGIILGFGISTTVGLFFGIYPAMKAARLDPIKALSYE